MSIPFLICLISTIHIRKRTRCTHHEDARHQKLTCTKHARALNDLQNKCVLCIMCYSPVIIKKVTFALRTAQKARPSGSVSNRLPNEQGEHGADCWLRFQFSFFLNCGHSYDVAM